MNKLIEVTCNNFHSVVTMKEGYNNIPLLIEYAKLNNFPPSIIQWLENTPLIDFFYGVRFYCALAEPFVFDSPYITVYTEQLLAALYKVSSLFVEHVKKHQSKLQLDNDLKLLLSTEDYDKINVSMLFYHIITLSTPPKQTVKTYTFTIFNEN